MLLASLLQLSVLLVLLYGTPILGTVDFFFKKRLYVQVSRIMNLRNKVVGALSGASLLGIGITAVIQANEGYSSSAYLDSAGVPTICYGETKHVQMGQKRSLSDCQRQLIQSAGEYARALVGLPESLPDVVILGSIDMTYNVGVSAFNNSTVKRLLIQGDYEAAGRAVLAWKYITIKVKGKRIKYDCSQLIQGKPNRICWGVWVRRQWQSKAIGNNYSSVQTAVQALTKE